jgi:hypothetical protein
VRLASAGAMIEVTSPQADHVLSIYFKGMQSAAAFGALSDGLPQRRSQRRWCLLFDWSELDGWDDRRVFNLSCRSWHGIADQIARASIVHRHRWNHQAALLAAVLRVHGVQVRSWPTSHRAQALTWLFD